MARFDRFEGTSYSADADFYEPSMGDRLGDVGGALKKRKGLIIGLIIIAIVGFFLYDFFIGSYRTVDFSLENTEGSSLSAQVFKIYDSTGEKVFEKSGDSRFSVRLKLGDYTIDARASSDYETHTGYFLSVIDDMEEPMVFEKTISASITGFRENFPKTLVAGQQDEFDIFVENKGSETQGIDFVLEGDLEELGLQVPSVTIGGHNSETVTVKINVPQDISSFLGEEDSDEEAYEISGSIRIKYTTITADVPGSAKLYGRPDIEFDPSDIDVAGNAGDVVIEEFLIVNNSPFPITDISLSIVITSIADNSETEIFDSLDLIQGTSIDSIAGYEEHRNSLRFSIPVTAKQETITVNIIAESKMLPQPLELHAILTIEEEAQFGLEVESDITYTTIDFDEATGGYFEESSYILVSNIGEMDLQDVYVSVENDNECNSGWLEFKERDIPLLRAGESKNLLTELSVPLINNGETMSCQIRYQFRNPLPEGASHIVGYAAEWVQITPGERYS